MNRRYVVATLVAGVALVLVAVALVAATNPQPGPEPWQRELYDALVDVGIDMNSVVLVRGSQLTRRDAAADGFDTEAVAVGYLAGYFYATIEARCRDRGLTSAQCWTACCEGL